MRETILEVLIFKLGARAGMGGGQTDRVRTSPRAASSQAYCDQRDNRDRQSATNGDPHGQIIAHDRGQHSNRPNIERVEGKAEERLRLDEERNPILASIIASGCQQLNP